MKISTIYSSAVICFSHDRKKSRYYTAWWTQTFVPEFRGRPNDANQSPPRRQIVCNPVNICFSQVYTIINKKAPKSILNIFDCKLKTNYRIFIIFGTSIPDTTCHQTTIQFPTSSNVCFCTSWRKHNQWNITFLFNATWLLKHNA